MILEYSVSESAPIPGTVARTGETQLVNVYASLTDICCSGPNDVDDQFCAPLCHFSVPPLAVGSLGRGLSQKEPEGASFLLCSIS